MTVRVGVRREDKNKWERRVPLTPSDLHAISRDHGLDIFVQPSPIRIFPDAAYSGLGIEMSEDLSSAGLIVAVKEIPMDLLREGQAYICFSHTAKGQDYNMPNLRRMMELGCSLVDYEKIADDDGRRLIFFSIHAGYAGMIESLRTLGLRLQAQGRPTPLADLRQPWQYGDLGAAETGIRDIGDRLGAAGAGDGPLVIGIAGYGNVSNGAQAVLEWLPHKTIDVADLPRAAEIAGDSPLAVVVFRESDMVEPVAGGRFKLQDYYDNPERYTGCFAKHLPHLDMLVNTIYWEERYPRLVTRDWVAGAFAGGAEPRLKVVGDISCDIEGSIETTVKATSPDEPNFVFGPDGSIVDGVEGRGLVMMTVDNLPCELPKESSEHFSRVLRDMVQHLARADWKADFKDLELPTHLERAVILHRGELTPAYGYMAQYLAE